MATAEMQYYSVCLCRRVTFFVILPNDTVNLQGEYETIPMKLLVLLHGYGEEGSVWRTHTNIEELAEKYHLCVVMPSGENSFYLDRPANGRAYGTFVGKELPEYVERTFGIHATREDTIIGGLSMGGFGAIHTALQFPERFGNVLAMSCALIHRDICNMQPGTVYKLANYEYYRDTFGPLDQLSESDNNPEVLVERLIKTQGQTMLPKLYMAVGRADFLLEQNRQFAQFLRERQVEFTYIEDEGDHNYVFWNKYLEAGLAFYLGEKQ